MDGLAHLVEHDGWVSAHFSPANAVVVRLLRNTRWWWRHVDLVHHLALPVGDDDGDGFVVDQKIPSKGQIRAIRRLLNQPVCRRKPVGPLFLLCAQILKQGLGVGHEFRALLDGLHPQVHFSLFFVADDGRQMLCVAQGHDHDGRSREKQQPFGQRVLHQ